MPETALTVATWNMHKGIGSDRRRDIARTTSVIAEIGPDVMALQEVDLRFGSRAGLLDLDHLHHRTGLTPVLVDTPGPSHGWHGNLILLKDGSAIHTELLRLPGLEPRGALVTEVDLGGIALRIVAAHFGLLRRSRQQQVHALLEHLDRREPRPTLLMGDLNEWRTGPGSPLTHLSRHFRLAPPVRSFPARFPMLPLDRMMVGPVGEIVGLQAHDTTLSRRASDHLPLKGRLILPESGSSA